LQEAGDARSRSYARKEETSNKRASYTYSALSIILADVDPAEVPETMLVGLLGWVNELATKPRRGSSRLTPALFL
jgi:hypothetical protein